MALPGPAPKANKVGRTPNADWTDVPDAPYVEGRKRALPKGQPWAAQTKVWWAIVREMPHAALWSESDWLFAMDTAIFKNRFYLGEAGPGEMTEMRRREDLMAFSTEARRKARIRYVAPPPADAPPEQANNVRHIRATRRQDLLGDDS